MQSAHRCRLQLHLQELQLALHHNLDIWHTSNQLWESIEALLVPINQVTISVEHFRLLVVLDMVHTYDSVKDLPTAQVIHGKDSGALIFIHDESKATRFPGFFIPWHVNVGDFAIPEGAFNIYKNKETTGAY
jgi:hypothetical protein